MVKKRNLSKDWVKTPKLIKSYVIIICVLIVGVLLITSWLSFPKFGSLFSDKAIAGKVICIPSQVEGEEICTPSTPKNKPPSEDPDPPTLPGSSIYIQDVDECYITGTCDCVKGDITCQIGNFAPGLRDLIPGKIMDVGLPYDSIFTGQGSLYTFFPEGSDFGFSAYAWTHSENTPEYYGYMEDTPEPAQGWQVWIYAVYRN